MMSYDRQMNAVNITSEFRTTPPFARLGGLVVRHRWRVLAGYIVAALVFGGVGVQVFGTLKSEGFVDPGGEAARASAYVDNQFGAADPAVVLLIKTPNNVDGDASLATALLDKVADVPGVQNIVSYWSTSAPSLRSDDKKTGQAFVFATPDTDLERLSTDVVDIYTGQQGELVVYAFGGGVIGNAFSETISGDLARAESVAVPLTAILLVFVLGSVVAAGLPFLVAIGTILGSFLVLYFISLSTDVSIFSLNLVTGLGLALGIDYSLLIINRFREELGSGKSVPDAVVATMNSAGKTVFVSGITVVVALAALLFFPQYFLRSFGYAGIAVSVLAVLGALTAIPALLAILGPRINKLKVRRGNLLPRDEGGWATLTRFVMRRPWPVMMGTIALLVVLAAPALGAVFGQVDERALPAESAVAQAGQVIRDEFPGYENAPYEIVVLNAESLQKVREYAQKVSLLKQVERVTTPKDVIVDGKVLGPNRDSRTWTSGNDVRVAAIGTVPPIDPAGEQLLADIRAIPAPGSQTLVGGVAADWADATASIIDRFWLVIAWLALATLVILFLYTGSVLIPIKAFVLNLLSLSAALGVLVWVFQNGRLKWLTGDYTVTGTVDMSTLVLIGVIAFALSMDYEVFMLSRITEEHVAGRDTADAVAFGLQRTGRIITAAALLIALVFLSFLTSGATNIKQLGLGVTVAILLDATVVRAFLVPAFMRIAGNANWWSPMWLGKIHQRIGLQDN
jgi:RND superfamily putative drug exporter